jgi:hypothetical protein
LLGDAAGKLLLRFMSGLLHGVGLLRGDLGAVGFFCLLRLQLGDTDGLGIAGCFGSRSLGAK